MEFRKHGTINVQWLRSEAYRLVKKHWNLDSIPHIQVDVLNDNEWREKEQKIVKLPATNMLAFYSSKEQLIEFNSTANARQSKSQIRGTLLHELCHWYLHINNRSWKDSDVSFARLLIDVRASNTCNSDEDAKNAMKKAQAYRRNEVFEVRDKELDVTIHLKHPSKSDKDFREDLQKSYISFYKEIFKENEEETYNVIDEIVYYMTHEHGYKDVTRHVTDYYDFEEGTTPDRDSISWALQRLGMEEDDIEELLNRDKELQPI